MGNGPSGHRRVSEDDENSSASQGNKKKLIVQPSQEGHGEDAISHILHQTSLSSDVSTHRATRGSRLSYSEGVHAAHMSPSPVSTASNAPKTLPTVFKWEGGGKEVFITGTFNGWRAKIPMSKSKHNFYTIIDLPEGEHQYKFIVDSQYKVDPNQGLTPANSSTSSANNVIVVKPSDFDVLEALSHDMAHSKTSQQQHQHGQSASAGPPSRRQRTFSVDSGDDPKHTVPIPNAAKDDKFASGTGGSPNGEYGQEEPQVPFLEEIGCAAKPQQQQNPPLLPPHLLQVILNKSTGAQCDPNLLPHPNHVMVNHMYALSIKDGVIVLSAITRYRKKFVSTVVYKPI